MTRIRRVTVGGLEYRVYSGRPGRATRIEVWRHGRWWGVSSKSSEARNVVRALTRRGKPRKQFVPLRSPRGRVLQVRQWSGRVWRWLWRWGR